MKVRELIKRWEKAAAEMRTAREYRFRLPVRDAARVAALAEIFPQREVEQILTDLVTLALDEVESALPYVQGARAIAEDERGDPIFEDIGPTPRFRDLTEKYTRELEAEARGK